MNATITAAASEIDFFTADADTIAHNVSKVVAEHPDAQHIQIDGAFGTALDALVGEAGHQEWMESQRTALEAAGRRVVRVAPESAGDAGTVLTIVSTSPTDIRPWADVVTHDSYVGALTSGHMGTVASSWVVAVSPEEAERHRAEIATRTDARVAAALATVADQMDRVSAVVEALRVASASDVGRAAIAVDALARKRAQNVISEFLEVANEYAEGQGACSDYERATALLDSLVEDPDLLPSRAVEVRVTMRQSVDVDIEIPRREFERGQWESIHDRMEELTERADEESYGWDADDYREV